MGSFTDQDREKLVEVHTIVKSQSLVLRDHERRIRKNEAFRHKAMAWAGMAGLGFSMVWDYIKDKLHGP